MLSAPATIRSTDQSDGEVRPDDVSDFVRVRPRLVGTAHRILGSWTEAEDIVQDAWLRWQTYDRTTVLNATAFLVTTTTRLAINAARSARARREAYVGHWLPEPVATSDDPALGVERSEALEHGILLLLQRLSPTERAAYVLRHAFDYPYPQIAAMLRLTEANVRQLVSRAGHHIAAGPCHPTSRAEQERLVHAFVAAARHGEVAALERLLTPMATGRPVRRHPGIAHGTVSKPRSLVRPSPVGHPPRRRGR
jgi:RNA polymerase sigma-70 factor (ECF subfamily)